MLGTEQCVVQSDRAKNENSKPNGELICHCGPERKRPPR